MNKRNMCLFFFVLLMILPKLSFSEDFPTRRAAKTLTILDTNSPFILSYDIAIDKGRNIIYVPNNRTHKIQAYDSTGKFLFNFGVDKIDGALIDIRGLWVDQAGKIFVVSSGNNQVFVFDSQGSFLFKLKTETYSMDVVSNSSGDIFVSINNLSNAKVMVYDSEGKYKYSLKKIPINDNEKIEFGAPGWLSMTIDDHLLVTDSLTQRIYAFDKKGKLINFFGGSGDTVGKFYSLSGIAVDNKNRIYVADKTRGYIQIFTRDGEFLAAVANEKKGPIELSIPAGIAFDEKGKLYCLEELKTDIIVFDFIDR